MTRTCWWPGQSGRRQRSRRQAYSGGAGPGSPSRRVSPRSLSPAPAGPAGRAWQAVPWWGSAGRTLSLLRMAWWEQAGRDGMGRDRMQRDGSPCPAPPLAPRSILWKLLGMSKAPCMNLGYAVWASPGHTGPQSVGPGRTRPLGRIVARPCCFEDGRVCTCICTDGGELPCFSALGMSLW